MLRSLQETIVAEITAPGRAAVSVLRISGPESWSIANSLFSPWPSAPEPRHAYYGRIADMDDGLMLLFEVGKSFTGDATVEFNVHGSRAVVGELLEHCHRLGARMARPGEFTERAWINGKVDLTQAEGIADTIAATTSAQRVQADRLKQGDLTHQIMSIKGGLLSILALIEAHVDFSEELGPLDVVRATDLLEETDRAVAQLIDGAERARWVRDGIAVAILGQPNVGKSSFLNALTQSDRAIVTDIPGTTRDVIEVQLEIRGFLVRLLDTAGLRETEDVVEKIGVARSRKSADDAEIILYLYDASCGWTTEDESIWTSLPQGKKSIKLGTKVDLIKSPTGLGVSSLTGEGLGEVCAAILDAAGLTEPTSAPLINQRHLPHLLSVREMAARTSQALQDEYAPPDLATVFLREAVTALDDLLGANPQVDWSDEIFSRFCIGK